jgi:predicted nucleic acid-binding protein
MNIAITDACIFIDLYELQLTAEFFGLEIQVHTSVDVINELYINQQQLLKAFESVGKLTVHKISESDRLEILKTPYSKALSESDKSVLHLATKLNASLLSSDKKIRQTAKNNAIEYHGMFWIFDQLVNFKLITKQTAIVKLKKLVESNLIYQNNQEILFEMNKRLQSWK